MGNADWKLILIASVAGIMGASLGTWFMQKNLQPQTVKKILAIILILMAVKLIFKVI